MDFRQLNLKTEKHFGSIVHNRIFQLNRLRKRALPMNQKANHKRKQYFQQHGQFCFKRIPFSIAAAPGTFEEMIVNVLEGFGKK